MQRSKTFLGLDLTMLELMRRGMAQKGQDHERPHVQLSAQTTLVSKAHGVRAKYLENAAKLLGDNPGNDTLAKASLATWMHFVKSSARLSTRMDHAAQ